MITAITKKPDGESAGASGACEPDGMTRNATLGDFTGLVLAAGTVVLAATFFTWMLFSF
jgi:hypothetical protein